MKLPRQNEIKTAKSGSFVKKRFSVRAAALPALPAGPSGRLAGFQQKDLSALAERSFYRSGAVGDYSPATIASLGQTPAQVPQSMHLSGSMT